MHGEMGGPPGLGHFPIRGQWSPEGGSTVGQCFVLRGTLVGECRIMIKSMCGLVSAESRGPLGW